MKNLFAFSIILYITSALSAQSTKIKGIDVVFVKGGSFNMGGAIINIHDTMRKDLSTFPVHKVLLSDFYIGKYEITNKQYCNFINKLNLTLDEILERIDIKSKECKIKYKDNKCYVMSGYDSYPVTFVNYFAMKDFCEALGGRLPTEAEWEYVAKGGSISKGYTYSGSNNINDVAVTKDNYWDAQPVGSLKPNELGIYDMSGNVSECCYDWFQFDYFKENHNPNPKGPDKPIEMNGNIFKFKVVKGCSFIHKAFKGISIISLRGNMSVKNIARGNHVGFRIYFPKK